MSTCPRDFGPPDPEHPLPRMPGVRVTRTATPVWARATTSRRRMLRMPAPPMPSTATGPTLHTPTPGAARKVITWPTKLHSHRDKLQDLPDYINDITDVILKLRDEVEGLKDRNTALEERIEMLEDDIESQT